MGIGRNHKNTDNMEKDKIIDKMEMNEWFSEEEEEN